MSNYWKTIPVKPDDNPSDKTEKEGNNPSFHSPLIYSIIKGEIVAYRVHFPQE